MLPLFGRKKQENKPVHVKSKALSQLEQLAGSDKDTYEALTAVMFLDPRKIEPSIKQAVDMAKKSEKDGEVAKAGMYYEVAGGLAIYEGDAAKVSEYYGQAERVTGRKYAILSNPEKAVALAQEYYKKFLLS